MALTWDDITSKTNKHIVPRLVDNVYNSSPVFTRLRTRNAERFEGGSTIRHPIAYAELNGGAFQRGGTFNQMVEVKHRLIQGKPGLQARVTLTKQRILFEKRMQVQRLSGDAPIIGEAIVRTARSLNLQKAA